MFKNEFSQCNVKSKTGHFQITLNKKFLLILVSAAEGFNHNPEVLIVDNQAVLQKCSTHRRKFWTVAELQGHCWPQ